MGWFVVKTAPGAEAKVLEALRLRRVAAWYPREIFWRRRFGRRVHHVQPLVRGYVFAAFRGRLHLVHELSGATGLLTLNGAPVEVSVKPVGAMRRAERAGEFDHCKTPPPPKAGDKVRVVRGLFAGRLAVIVRLDQRRRKSLFLAMLDGVGRMDAAPQDVELADAA